MAMAPTVWLNPPPCSGRLRDFSRPSKHLFRAGLLSSSILRRKLDDRTRQRRQSYTSDPREGTTTVAAFRSFLLVRIEETILATTSSRSPHDFTSTTFAIADRARAKYLLFRLHPFERRYPSSISLRETP